MPSRRLFLTAVLSLFAASASHGQGTPAPAATATGAGRAATPAAPVNATPGAAATDWYALGAAAVAATAAARPRPARARNVILFIGDGMSLDTATAARIFAGQRRGASGEEHWLNFETLPYSALMKTYTVDLQVPDSAGTATAMLSGVKTLAGVIGVDETVELERCESVAGSRVESFLELMEARGRSTGVVTTARITHATPAATYAHAPSRDWENDTLVGAAEKACADIAAQLTGFDIGDGIEVVLGGGRASFFPAGMPDPEYPDQAGVRADGRNLVEEWQRAAGPASRYVWNRAQFQDLNLGSTERVFGLFEPSHMQYEADRVATSATEPSLAEMTTTAIRMLSRNDQGYFLLVEGGRIDHAHHAGNAARALGDTLAFDAAVAAARKLVDLDETLIIVTADHGHVLSFSGYPRRGNPILGKVVTGGIIELQDGTVMRDLNGLPYTTLGYANGPGHRDPAAHNGGRPNLTEVDTTALSYLQEAGIPMLSETHSGTDVVVYADGPSADLFRGVQEQNYIYHVMRRAIGH